MNVDDTKNPFCSTISICDEKSQHYFVSSSARGRSKHALHMPNGIFDSFIHTHTQIHTLPCCKQTCGQSAAVPLLKGEAVSVLLL